MAIYHGHLKILSRSDRNTVQAIAYRTGTDLYDERSGKWFYYSSKKDVIHVELILPENAPQWAKDLQLKIAKDRTAGIQELSNIVEGAENRKDSRVWREFEFALPKELTEEQNKAVARAFLEKQAARFKVGVVGSFHMKEDPHTGQELLHCHATFMEREMTEQGLSKKKQRFLDNPEFLTTLRVDWMRFANEWLKACGFDVRIDHRSYAAQGLDILPQPKLARGMQTMERKSEARPRPSITEIINHPGTVFDPVTQQYAALNGKALAQNQAPQVVKPQVMNTQISERVSLSLTASSQALPQTSLTPTVTVSPGVNSLGASAIPANFQSAVFNPLPASRGMAIPMSTAQSMASSQGTAPVLMLSRAGATLPSQAPFGAEFKIENGAVRSSLTTSLPLTSPPLEANPYLTLPTFNPGIASNLQESQALQVAVSKPLQVPRLMLSRAGVSLKSALVFAPEMNVYQEAVNSSLSPHLLSQFQQTGADSGLRSVAVTTALVDEFSASLQSVTGIQSLKTPLGASLHQRVSHSLLNALPTLAFNPESCTSSGLDSWQLYANVPGSSAASLDLGHGSYDRPVRDGTSLARRIEFDRVRHRNVATLMASPTKVLDMVTRQQSTFMWGEVEKTLARYVKEEPIYQRLEAQIKNSAELILLREHHHKREDGTVENVSVYTTRSVLTQELSLMDLAEKMAVRQSHATSESALDQAIEKTAQEMAAKGHELSPDQMVALRHVTQRDQLSCVIGYAGAGKSTMMKTAKMAWEASGYKVYGLAPTGRAAQNLEEIGLKSQTVHKFLKDYSHGRSQYHPKSVLILDEAGMVDVPLFHSFLQAADRLGVKVVVVGDPAQNQPYGRGNGLRVVTDVLGTHKVSTKMDTVVRQQVEWQREATRLFGGYDTKQALRLYLDRGHVHFIDEKVPSLKKLVAKGRHEEVVQLYNLSRRVAGNLWQVIERETAQSSGKQVQHHQDFERFKQWQEIRQRVAHEMTSHMDTYRHLMKQQGVDPQSFASLFVSDDLSPQLRSQKIRELVNTWCLKTPEAHQRMHVCDPRQDTRTALLTAWAESQKQQPEKSHLILAYTNKDADLLNDDARAMRRKEGHVGIKEYAFDVQHDREDDFGRSMTDVKKKHFSQGDRLIFTRNDKGLGVKNGSLGTIVDIGDRNIKVKMDGDDRVVSFAPKLMPYFDQGWAITIQKAQSATAALVFYLATSQEGRNETYVAKTRQQEEVQTFVSVLDSHSPEVYVDQHATSNEKLMALDHLPAREARAAVKPPPSLIESVAILGNQLQAGKYYLKEEWANVCAKFTGRTRPEIEDPVRMFSPVLDEASRARLMMGQHAVLPSILSGPGSAALGSGSGGSSSTSAMASGDISAFLARQSQLDHARAIGSLQSRYQIHIQSVPVSGTLAAHYLTHHLQVSEAVSSDIRFHGHVWHKTSVLD